MPSFDEPLQVFRRVWASACLIGVDSPPAHPSGGGLRRQQRAVFRWGLQIESNSDRRNPIEQLRRLSSAASASVNPPTTTRAIAAAGEHGAARARLGAANRRISASSQPVARGPACGTYDDKKPKIETGYAHTPATAGRHRARQVTAAIRCSRAFGSPAIRRSTNASQACSRKLANRQAASQ